VALQPRSVEQKSEESMRAKLPQAHFLLSCRQDHTSRIIDVGKGLQTHVFRQLVKLEVQFRQFKPLPLRMGKGPYIKLWDARIENQWIIIIQI